MKLHTALFFALSLAAMSPTYAADDVKESMEDRAEARYDAAKDTAKQDYKRAKADCERLPGNAKDVCMKEAEAAYVKAKSEATVGKKAAEGQAEATADQMKASYKAEKEKCEKLSGSAKGACIDNAKMKYRQ
ncbi:MAG: hypothetical protein U0932_07415 [Thiobacillus sp.]|nr:hypothetical protein [Thiobacillus sp.]